MIPITVTPGDIADRINGYQLSDTSTPSRATVEQMIAEATAYVTMLVTSKGVTVAAGSSQATYLRGVVIRAVCAEAERARQRGASSYATDLSDAIRREVEDIVARAATLANADTGIVDKGAHGPSRRATPTSCSISRWRKGGVL